jgi:hypothetical protein
VLEPAKVDYGTIFELERAAKTALKNGLVNGDMAGGLAGISKRIRLIRENDDPDIDGTFGSIAVVLEFKSVIILGLCTARWVIRRLRFKRRKPEGRTL